MKSGLVVTATGHASAPPDQVSINLGVSTVRPDAGAALGEVSEKIGELIAALVGLGIARESLQTADLSLWAETDRHGSPAGYRARNTIHITLDDTGRVGEVLSVGLRTIGGGAEMNNISFALKDPSAVAAVARERAYLGAVAKANQLVGLAGRGLGQVLAITETEGGGFEPRPMARMAIAESMPTEAGTAAVAVTLTVRFALVGS